MAEQRRKLPADTRREADAMQVADSKTVAEERETAPSDLRAELLKMPER